MFRTADNSPLKPFQIPNWRKQRAKQVAKLPKKLATLGRRLLDLDTKKKDRPYYVGVNVQRVEPDELASLSAAERRRLFRACLTIQALTLIQEQLY